MPSHALSLAQRPLRYAAGALVGCAAPVTFLGKSLGFVIVGALICFAAASLAEPARWKRLIPARAILREPLFWAVAAMLASWLVSAFWTLDPPRSPLVWLQCFGLIALCWILTQSLSGDALAYGVALRALIVGALVSGIFVCLANFVEPRLLSLVRIRAVEQAYQVRDVVKFFGSVLPPASFVAIYAGRRLGGAWRWAGYATVPIALLLAAGLQSAAGLVGFAGALVALGIFFAAARARSQIAVLIILLPLVMAGAAAGWIVARLPTPPVTSAEQIVLPTWLIDRHRQVIWGFALYKAVRGPAFGYGLNTAGRIPGAKDEIAPFKGQYIPSHTHNWVVQAAVETGLPGMVTALAALACLIGYLFARARKGAEAAWAALAMTVSVFVSWLFNFSLFAGWWQMAFVVLLAIPLAALSRTHAADPPPGLTEADAAPRTGR